MDLILISLGKSLLQRVNSLRYAASPLAQTEPELKEQFRTAAIKHFELAEEL